MELCLENLKNLENYIFITNSNYCFNYLNTSLLIYLLGENIKSLDIYVNLKYLNNFAISHYLAK